MREILMRMNSKNIRTNLAVSEIIGTIIMLGIATTSLSSVSYHVLSAPAPIPTPIVEISGTIDDNQVIVTHRGGEPLDLDTELNLNVGGKSKSYKVGDLLDSKSKEDGVWSLSEKLVYPLDYDFDYSIYPNIDINIVDGYSNSLLMTGLTRVNPTCDLGLTIKVDDLNPEEFEVIEFTITVSNYGNINASGALIDFLLPEGLIYHSSTMEQGSYDSNAGIWDIGQLLSGETIELTVKATVGALVYDAPTQLVVLLDGSGSIEPANWTLMLNGLSAAVKDGDIFPHNGCVEFTVIQFGGKNPSYAQVEIAPIVIKEENFDSIVEGIQKIFQIGDKTPTSCAVYLAADVLKNAGMFAPNTKQVVLLVTDGNPTHNCGEDGDYIDDSTPGIGPKEGVVVAREYLVDLLNLNEYDDEFNALSIEITGDGHTYDLRDNVVWPQPGYETVDFSEKHSPNRGWVRSVETWEDFAYSINGSFQIIFNGIIVDVNIHSTAFSDPKEVNDLSSVLLEPTIKDASAIEK